MLPKHIGRKMCRRKIGEEFLAHLEQLAAVVLAIDLDQNMVGHTQLLHCPLQPVSDMALIPQVRV